MRWYSGSLSLLTASLFLSLSCGEGKLPQPDLDYGPEDSQVAAKDDSATNPASMARLTLDRPLRTTFSATSRWRAFKLAAVAGRALDIFVDGLRGLDTVAYVYNISTTTGRPYGRSIARNDDTETDGWTSNASSSSIEGFVPRYSRDYAIVVTTYRQVGRGFAQVLVRGSGAPAIERFFVTSNSGQSVTIADTRGQALEVSPAVNDLLGAASEVNPGPPLFAAAYRFSPADLDRALRAGGDAQSLMGGAFSDSLGYMSEYVPGPEISLTSVDAHLGGSTVANFLQYTLGDLDPTTAPSVRDSFGRLAAALTRDGATHAFQTHYDNGDDMNYDGLMAADAATGEVRIVGFRNDP
jgi:hypothetical protein